MNIKYGAAIVAAACLAAIGARADVISSVPTNADSPLPAGSCLLVDQGGTTDAKLCGGYAAAFGAVPLNGAGGTPSSLDLTNASGLPVSTGISGLGAGVATFLVDPSSVNLLGALTDKTGTGPNVFATGPTVSGLTLGDVAGSVQCLHVNTAGVVSGTGSDCGAGGGGATNPAGASGDIQTNNAGVFGALTPGAGIAAFLATPTSANLAAALTNETGTGSAVFGTSPTLVSPNLGTPTQLTLTNATGLPASALTGLAPGMPAFLAGATSANLRAALTDETGSGAAVFGTGPTVSGLLLGDVTGSTQCLHVSSAGLVTGTGADCGAGGGGSMTTTDGTTSVASTTTLTFGTGFKVGGSGGSATVNLSSTTADKTASGQAIVAGDAGKTVLVGANAYTLAQAGTAGFEAGYSPGIINNGTSGNATVTATTSTFKGAGGGTSVTLKPGYGLFPMSDGTDYQTLLTVNTVGLAANLPLFSDGGGGFTAGTRQGNTTKVFTTTGSFTAGNAVTVDANGNAVDAGVAPGGGGGSGTVSSGAANAIARYASLGTTVSASALLTDDGAIVKNSGAFALSGTNTPTTLSGNVNDYNPASLSSASALRIGGGAADRTITGLAGGVDGRIVTIANIGSSNNLILSNADAASTAANRFQLSGNVVLPPNTSLALRYDGTSSLWRPLSRALANTGVTAGSYTCTDLTVGVDGRITTAANGTCSGGSGATLLTFTSGSATIGTGVTYFSATSNAAYASTRPLVSTRTMTLSKLICNQGTAPSSGNPMTYTLVVNGSDNTNQQVTVGVGANASTTVNDVGVAVSRGDTYGIHATSTGTIGSTGITCAIEGA